MKPQLHKEQEKTNRKHNGHNLLVTPDSTFGSMFGVLL